jgi:hypothetical protein
MYKNIKEVYTRIKNVLFLTEPGVNLKTNSDDIFLVSYPKSGNTWIRFVIANVINNGEVDFSNIDNIIPDIYQTKERTFNSLCQPRIIKSHECFSPKYNKVIYVVRDPRDVVISYYKYHKLLNWIDDSFDFDCYLERFVAGNIISSEPFGSWEQNLLSWHYCGKNILFIRYEDLLNEPHTEMEKILNFSGIECSSNTLTKAINNSSLIKMRELEILNKGKWSTTKRSKGKIGFVGSGKSGKSYNRRTLSSRQENIILSNFREGMRLYDYA